MAIIRLSIKSQKKVENMIEFPFILYSFFFWSFTVSVPVTRFPRILSALFAFVIVVVDCCLCVCGWQVNATIQCQNIWALSPQSHYHSMHVRETLNCLPALSDSLKLNRCILPFINERGVQLK